MVIDTNVYSAMDAGKSSATQSIKTQQTIQMTTPVLAELKYGFEFGSRAEENKSRLNRFLAQGSVEILSPALETTDVYAVLAAMCRRSGKSLSNNDLWIAALAKQHGQTLLTYDQDFSVFQDMFGEKLMIIVD